MGATKPDPVIMTHPDTSYNGSAPGEEFRTTPECVPVLLSRGAKLIGCDTEEAQAALDELLGDEPVKVLKLAGGWFQLPDGKKGVNHGGLHFSR
jgi:hypothetical protein